MTIRSLSLLDRCLIEVDAALRTVGSPARPTTPSPGANENPEDLSVVEQDNAARLMRVNHSGEIAAQALYRGQAFVAKEPRLREALLRASADEHDHLAWCADRVHELGHRTSLFTPVWYSGSFVIGALAGLAGDRVSLGFLAETERQVTAHLDGHLNRLPDRDTRSRRILEQMREEEVEHGRDAVRRGGAPLPKPLQSLMQSTARVMTSLSYWL